MPLWQGDHVSTQQLWSYFAQYLYLPRLRDRSVLVGAIESGVASTGLGAGHVRLRAGASTRRRVDTSGSSPGRARPSLIDGASVVVKSEAREAQLDDGGRRYRRDDAR